LERGGADKREGPQKWGFDLSQSISGRTPGEAHFSGGFECQRRWWEHCVGARFRLSNTQTALYADKRKGDGGGKKRTGGPLWGKRGPWLTNSHSTPCLGVSLNVNGAKDHLPNGGESKKKEKRSQHLGGVQVNGKKTGGRGWGTQTRVHPQANLAGGRKKGGHQAGNEIHEHLRSWRRIKDKNAKPKSRRPTAHLSWVPNSRLTSGKS